MVGYLVCGAETNIFTHFIGDTMGENNIPQELSYDHATRQRVLEDFGVRTHILVSSFHLLHLTSSCLNHPSLFLFLTLV